jgi:adenine deaminase
MNLHRRLRLDPAARRRIVEVAAGEREADLAVRGGRVLNVFTGKLERVDLAVTEGRVARLGEVDEAAAEVDVDGAVVVPGLIDAHAHADILTSPATFAREVVRHGTTAAVIDTFSMLRWLPAESVRGVLEGQAEATLKFLWAINPDRTTFQFDRPYMPSAELLRELVAELPGVVSSGELTTWPQLLAGSARTEEFVAEVANRALRVDGHLAGVSPATLARVVAAGVTSDHEAIDGPELTWRIGAGLWTMIRLSSLRPDAAELAAALVVAELPFHERILLTTDGIDPEDLARGHLDVVVRTVIAAGVEPSDAVRMASLNPATYHALDAHLGSLAPGRCADMVVLRGDLAGFEPELVIAEGVPLDAATVSGGSVDWASMRIPFGRAEIEPERLAAICEEGPALRLKGVVLRPEPDFDPARPDWRYAALVRRDGSAVTGARVVGIECGELASSQTGYRDVLLFGRDPGAMLAAYHRVVDAEGGLATPEETMPLPVLGAYSDDPVPEIARQSARITEAVGWPVDLSPLKWVTLFLTEAVMPGLALTPDGVFDVRADEVVRPAVAVASRPAAAKAPAAEGGR